MFSRKSSLKTSSKKCCWGLGQKNLCTQNIRQNLDGVQKKNDEKWLKLVIFLRFNGVFGIISTHFKLTIVIKGNLVSLLSLFNIFKPFFQIGIIFKLQLLSPPFFAFVFPPSSSLPRCTLIMPHRPQRIGRHWICGGRSSTCKIIPTPSSSRLLSMYAPPLQS